MSKALVANEVHALIRKNPTTGQIQRTSYVGSLRNKPAGWKIDRSKPIMPAMAAQSGTV